MNIFFENMGMEHQQGVMEIFNYYIENTTAAFRPNRVPKEFYIKLLEKPNGYPSYVIIDKDYSGKGLGSKCLEILEKEAWKLDIKNLIAEISSENEESINFHKKHGFTMVGEMKNIGKKFNRNFGVVIMDKNLVEIM